MKFIAGPCQHESLEISLDIARHCKDVCEKNGFEYYFKASFDKANRSHHSGIRGVSPVPIISLSQFTRDSQKIKENLGDVKILTDVHEVWQIERLEPFVDVLQIPAFLSRQTDLIRRAGHADVEAVNIKKGQFMAPWDLAGVISKTHDFHTDVWVTERGVNFGYNRLVVDFAGIRYILDNYPNVEFVFDATHSVQLPGAGGTSSGGNREYVVSLAKAAAAVGVRNFFMEVHPNPDESPSDGPNMLRLDDFETAVQDIKNHTIT